ncbi:MAG: hypothetical protein Q9159_004145 [Coniocarpon cinnabarinum]
MAISQDPLLEFLAESFTLTVVSVGYRLAPEHPWPAGPNDCFDVGEWLVDNAQEIFQAPLVAACGENHHYQTPLVLTGHIMEKYIEALLPGTTAEQRTSPDISPFYADFHKLKLPPALFAIGTEDPLLDDSVLMAARWQMALGKAVLKVYPGAPHGFCLFEDDAAEYVLEYKQDVKDVLGKWL